MTNKSLPYGNLKRIFEGSINTLPNVHKITQGVNTILFSKFGNRETLMYSKVVGCGASGTGFLKANSCKLLDHF